MSETTTTGSLAAYAQAPATASALEGPAVERIAELAREASKPEVILIPTDGLEPGLPARVPVLWDRHFQQVIPVIEHLEEARPKMRRKGTVKTDTLSSFIDMTNRHKDAGSVIFATTAWPEPQLTAVIDYHNTDGTARWGQHRIAYAFPLTEEFKAWIGKNAKPFDQEEFAAFLEEHAGELSVPYDGEATYYEQMFREKFATPAELLDLSRQLEVFVSATVKQGTRLQSGERQVEFTTEHMNGKGEPVVIPGIFMVSVAAFLPGSGEPVPIRIPARLRYRIKGGAIVWFYQLYRWEFFLRDRVQQDLAKAGKETSLPTFEGKPEMPAA